MDFRLFDPSGFEEKRRGQKDNRILDPVVIEGTAFLWEFHHYRTNALARMGSISGRKYERIEWKCKEFRERILTYPICKIFYNLNKKFNFVIYYEIKIIIATK